MSTLSVEISTSGWSSVTTSPSLTSHFVIVPSTTLSPICGIVTSIAISIRRQAANRVHDFVGARQNEVLERLAEQGVNAGHQVVEASEQIVVIVEAAVAEDIALGPLEDVEAPPEAAVNPGDRGC